MLITGGSSGIGLELARQLILRNNHVIICGRSEERLAAAKVSLPEVRTFSCDLAEDTGRKALVDWLTQHHPGCSVLINNAAIVHRTSFRDDDAMIQKAVMEIKTNLIAPIALTKMLLPHLERQPNAAVVNITTGLVYAPRAVYPVYSATKAALHAFTQVLRQQLKTRPIDVIEVMMPVVDTPWHQGNVPKIAIKPEAAVATMIGQLQRDKKEIRIGKVKLLYAISRLMPRLAFRMINRVS